ncbi:hypothetical protein Nans01_34080 [Nocardiopsis ansamitocini]|uniref:Uncharacterized protein n=1 Tax=Nocardiopsis ansamitocini TaxID=1670832 RepID=A0A9W6P8Q5_9ACTN|nr:hypothetical protein Nans01_34080 [Nocardiopsis ansamitocini]
MRTGASRRRREWPAQRVVVTGAPRLGAVRGAGARCLLRLGGRRRGKLASGLLAQRVVQCLAGHRGGRIRSGGIAALSALAETCQHRQRIRTDGGRRLRGRSATPPRAAGVLRRVVLGVGYHRHGLGGLVAGVAARPCRIAVLVVVDRRIIGQARPEIVVGEPVVPVAPLLGHGVTAAAGALLAGTAGLGLGAGAPATARARCGLLVRLDVVVLIDIVRGSGAAGTPRPAFLLVVLHALVFGGVVLVVVVVLVVAGPQGTQPQDDQQEYDDDDDDDKRSNHGVRTTLGPAA